jgi:alkylhydroperoxidase family enzyme
VSPAQIEALKTPGGRRDASLFGPEEQAVLRFTDHLTSYPGNIDSADLDELQAHLSEEQIVDLVVTIATTNWTNRINDGLQTPLG